jgi:ATP-binding protein involved in chromosome partitioning
MMNDADVLGVLAGFYGPDGRTKLSREAGIAGLTMRDGIIYLAIAIVPHQAAAYEPERARIEAALRAMAGVKAAHVTLTSDRPLSSPPAHSAQSEKPLGPKAQAAQRGTAIEGIAKIIAVASGKGGVGKSTTAANLALALAATGLKIGLLDADVYGPSVPRLFGVKDRPAVRDKRIIPHDVFGIKIMSIGFLVDEQAAMIWRGPMVMSAITQLLREVEWGTLDYLVVDMPPGTGDAQLTLAQSVPLTGAVIVSTPQDLALIDARRAVAMFQKVDVPIIGLIENMSYFLCPHCGGRSDIFAHGGARHEAEAMAVRFLGEVPLELAIRSSSDAGQPIVATQKTSAQTQIYMTIAHAVRHAVENAATGVKAPPRIVISSSSPH